LQLWELGGRKLDWLPGAAQALFARATEDGWDHEHGGFYYTLDWDGRPRIRDRYWWPCCEGIGAAAVLNAVDGDARYEAWYREIWNFVAARFLDRENGGWRAQLDSCLRPNEDPQPVGRLSAGPWLIRWALTTIRLAAACRNTSVRRTTGRAPDPMMSARTCPGPNDGNWSMSPTMRSAARSGPA